MIQLWVGILLPTLRILRTANLEESDRTHRTLLPGFTSLPPSPQPPKFAPFDQSTEVNRWSQFPKQYPN
jgi:hypothetical protein